MLGNKGLFYTIDIALFAVAIIMLITFAISEDNFNEKDINDDLVLKEAKSIMNGTENLIPEKSNFQNYICREFKLIKINSGILNNTNQEICYDW
jgi:hypothetical protein